MTEILHGHVYITRAMFDGKVANEKEAYDMTVFSTQDTILKDVIEALSMLSSRQTKEIDLNIKLDDKERYKLVKKWKAL